MSAAPLDPRLAIERLRSQVAGLQQVGAAADFATVKQLSGFRTPSAYVVLAQESAKERPTGNTTGRVRQVAEVTFGVVIAVRNYRHDEAEKSDALGPVLAAVRGAMIGWTPPLTLARPCQFVTGQVLDSDSSTLLWGEIYSTQHAIGSNP